MRWWLYSVGKTQQPDWAALEQLYYQRFQHYGKIELRYYKTMSQLTDALEVSSAWRVALTETGPSYTTKQMAVWYQRKVEQAQDVILVVGDAAGFSPAVLQQCQEQLSLSPLTFPHECARVLLLEQLYRVATVVSNHPYHK